MLKYTKMKRVIFTEDAPKPIGPFSQAIEINGTLFVSGQLPIDPIIGKIIDGNVARQTKQVMENLGSVLKSAGFSFSDIVKTSCLLKDINDFSEMNNIYKEYFQSVPPARVAYEVANLPLNALIEIDAIAIK
jgi:2-iminobutanoate/2-iminopropanoate deaminase